MTARHQDRSGRLDFDVAPLRRAGIALGVGMGGFVDGILFHQIFQLHNMLSALYFPDTLAKEQLNMAWDGIFHAATWATTALGIALLWRAARNAEVPLDTRLFVGSMILGWGLFNGIEGLIDHQIIGVHHVVERASAGMQVFWDMLFLASGAAMIVVGGWMIHRAQQSLEHRPGDVSHARASRPERAW